MSDHSLDSLSCRPNLSRRRWRFPVDHPNFPTVFAIVGFLAIFSISEFQSELIEISKSESSSEGNTFSGTIQGFLVQLRELYHGLPDCIRDVVWSIFANSLYLVVPFILLLEYLAPCRPDQPLLSNGFFQDSIWFVARTFLNFLVLSPTFSVLESFYNNYLSFLSIRVALSWPLALQILLAVLLRDFLHWVSHLMLHKSSVLWKFHAVHHSQKQLNVFTDDRVHPVELLFKQSVLFIPFFMFQVHTFPTVFLVVLAGQTLSRFVHANVQIDFGIIGYVLVSPQYHRVHHSKEARHCDKNFGGLFSIWDYIFGTAYNGQVAALDTGIANLEFPDEGRVKKLYLVLNLFRQITYPFEQLLQVRIKRNYSA
ncbi:MAG: sterol desaturase family protein [Gammaproteobacteria bacterium]